MAQEGTSLRKSAGHDHGFTLAELLVVLAVLALIALVLWNVSDPHDHWHQAACLSNTKQLGASVGMYAHDWDETLPPGIQTATAQVADLCPARKGAAVLSTVYDELFPYMKSTQIVQCPVAPSAIDMCRDIGNMAPELAGDPKLGIGNARTVGNFRYASYATNRTLFGLGGFNVAGEDIAQSIHKRLGSRLGLPYTLDQVPYPADTPALFDGYIVAQQPCMIAEARHNGTADVVYADGHSKAFHMAEQDQGDYAVDRTSGHAVNRHYIDHGPYRASPGELPNPSFNGIVTDPFCAKETNPSRECILRAAPPKRPQEGRRK